MEKRTMHIFGENVIDFEGILASELTCGASLTTEHLTLPVDAGIHIVEIKPNSEPIDYYCKILFDEQKMTVLDNHSIVIPVNEKYDLDGVIQAMTGRELDRWKLDEKINNFIDITLIGRSGGGGAHNSAYCAQVYLNSRPNIPLEARLVVPHKSSFIAKSLPQGLTYESILDNNDNFVTSNLNFRGARGEKINFRGRKSDRVAYNINLDKLKSKDIVVVDSIKDPAYIDAITQVLDCELDVDFYLAATDSMITKLGRERVYDLACRSDLLVCNNVEFNMLMGRNIRKDDELAYSLLLFQNDRKNRYEKGVNIAVTFGEHGSVLCDTNANICFQPTAIASRTTPFANTQSIINTNGCGDAYFAMMVLANALDYDSNMKINYANAAGHLCAFKPTAVDPMLFTNADIGNYRRDFGCAPILYYNMKSKRFE